MYAGFPPPPLSGPDAPLRSVAAMRTAITAIVAGLVSAVVVAVVILAAGIGDDEDQPAPAAVTPRAAPPSVPAISERAQRALVRIDARPPGTRIPSGPPREDDGVATGT